MTSAAERVAERLRTLQRDFERSTWNETERAAILACYASAAAAGADGTLDAFHRAFSVAADGVLAASPEGPNLIFRPRRGRAATRAHLFFVLFGLYAPPPGSPAGAGACRERFYRARCDGLVRSLARCAFPGDPGAAAAAAGGDTGAYLRAAARPVDVAPALAEWNAVLAQYPDPPAS